MCYSLEFFIYDFGILISDVIGHWPGLINFSGNLAKKWLNFGLFKKISIFDHKALSFASRVLKFTYMM